MSEGGLRGLPAVALLVVTGCGDPSTKGEGHQAKPLFPEDYRTSYDEVRDCRQSADHDLNTVRVLADPAARDPYLGRDQPFPVGAVLVKEEYEFGDSDCTGDIVQWTVMQRLAEQSSSDTLDWRWQRVDAGRNVVGEDTPRCYGCHVACTEDQGGYQSTCTVP